MTGRAEDGRQMVEIRNGCVERYRLRGSLRQTSGGYVFEKRRQKTEDRRQKTEEEMSNVKY